jgi:hypothetical protein
MDPKTGQETHHALVLHTLMRILPRLSASLILPAALLMLQTGVQAETHCRQGAVVKYVDEHLDPVLVAMRVERRTSDARGSDQAENSPYRQAVVRYVDEQYNPVLLATQVEHQDAEPDGAVEPPAEIPPQEDLNHGAKPIRLISINIDPPQGADLPEKANEAEENLFDRAGTQWHTFGYSRPWGAMSYAWTAPDLAYKPLYFEDANLERYGHHHGLLQPALSAAHFFGRIPALPYMYGAQPCHNSYYALGYYRPGECAPHFPSRPKPSLLGAVYTGAAATGLILLIP